MSVVLITGANRGIGKAITEQYLVRPNTIIIAGVRDTKSPTSLSLKDLKTGSGSKLILVTIASDSETSASEAVAALKSSYGISHIDLVVANAGMGGETVPALNTTVKDLADVYKTNTIGPVLLARATYPLLQKSSNPRFVIVSSVLGSIGAMEQAPMPGLAYGASKAAVNYVAKKIHLEYKDITAFVVHPGWIQTELGNGLATAIGMQSAPDTLEKCIPPLVSIFDKANREEHSGKFLVWDGSTLPW
ncbi:hypothetical protein F5884DRAFT_790000 [Xylogone sp. PMI_703]|nr:hypothetical protein F5884DRAFT_790000 [Xylogone sp. PMI_703]